MRDRPAALSKKDAHINLSSNCLSRAVTLAYILRSLGDGERCSLWIVVMSRCFYYLPARVTRKMTLGLRPNSTGKRKVVHFCICPLKTNYNLEVHMGYLQIFIQ